MASRAQLIAEVVKPALERGELVLADRFFLSTYAYQVMGRGLPFEEVRAANRLATAGLVPDLTILLTLPAAVRDARVIARGGADRIESAGHWFHELVERAFNDCASPAWQAAHPECGPIAAVNASGTEHEVLERVLDSDGRRHPRSLSDAQCSTRLTRNLHRVEHGPAARACVHRRHGADARARARRLAAAARAASRQRLVRARAAVRAGARARRERFRRLDSGRRSLSQGGGRARARAARSALDLSHAGEASRAQREHERTLRGHRHPDRRARRLDHDRRAAAGHAGRARGDPAGRPHRRDRWKVDGGMRRPTTRAACCAVGTAPR